MDPAEETISHSIAQDFTRTPGPRFRSEGKFSGEEFRQEFLEKWFAEARQQGAKLFIDLDGGYGYAPSFIEEAFGGLARIRVARLSAEPRSPSFVYLARHFSRHGFDQVAQGRSDHLVTLTRRVLVAKGGPR